MSGIRPGYHSGFAPRDGEPLYPHLWRNCIGAWAPSLGPSGVTLRDNSLFRNHGTLTNMDAASDWIVSGGKYALDFDGTNDYVVTKLGLSGLFRVGFSCWFNWAAYAADDDFLFEYTANINLAGNRGFSIDPNGSGSVFSIITSSGGGPYNGGTIPRPSAGVWHNLVVNFDRTRGTALNVDVWVDGVAQTVTQTQSGNIITSFADASLYWASRGGTTLFGNTLIDDVFVRDGLFTNNDISVLATRRGIAYEMQRRRRSSSQVTAGFLAAWAARQKTQLIGGGVG